MPRTDRRWRDEIDRFVEWGLEEAEWSERWGYEVRCFLYRVPELVRDGGASSAGLTPKKLTREQAIAVFEPKGVRRWRKQGTERHYKATLKSLCAWAGNPLALLRKLWRPGGALPERTHLPGGMDDTDRVISEARRDPRTALDPKLMVPLLLAGRLGLRFRSVGSLTVGDFDLVNDRLTYTTKGGRTEETFLVADVRSYFAEHLRDRPRSERVYPWTYTTALHRLRDAFRVAGLPTRSPFQALRHTALTAFVDDGWDPKVVVLAAAHRSFETTWESYYRKPRERLREALTAYYAKRTGRV